MNGWHKSARWLAIGLILAGCVLSIALGRGAGSGSELIQASDQNSVLTFTNVRPLAHHIDRSPSTPVAATPSPAIRTSRDFPDPAECRIVPRTTDEVMTLYREVNPSAATPIAGHASPVASTTMERHRPTLGEGAVAHQVVINGITRTYRELVACTNAQDSLRLLALLTDDAIRRRYRPNGDWPPPEATLVASLQTPPTPRAEERRQAIGPLQDARLLADGRATAIERFIWFDDNDVSWILSNLIVFDRPGERWLIDDIVVNIELPKRADTVDQRSATPSQTARVIVRAQTTPTPRKPTLVVRVSIPTFASPSGHLTPGIGEPCVGSGSYDGIGPTTEVVTVSTDGRVLASATLGTGTVVDNFDGTSRCRFTTYVEMDWFGSDFVVAVARHYRQGVHAGDLNGANRIVTFELGD